MEFSRPEYCSGEPFPSPGDLPKPGIEPRSLALQADSLPAEPWVKPKNTGVGSLSLLQWVFPTQELNWSLLHCRWILYQLSYQGSPPAKILQILKDDAMKVLHSICQQICKTQQWAQDWKRSVFIPIPKKGNAKECSNYCTIALISHANKIISKSSKVVFNSMWTEMWTEFQMFKLNLEKAEEPEIKLATCVGI